MHRRSVHFTHSSKHASEKQKKTSSVNYVVPFYKIHNNNNIFTIHEPPWKNNNDKERKKHVGWRSSLDENYSLLCCQICIYYLVRAVCEYTSTQRDCSLSSLSCSHLTPFSHFWDIASYSIQTEDFAFNPWTIRKIKLALHTQSAYDVYCGIRKYRDTHSHRTYSN